MENSVKKAYRKPEIVRVNLNPQELVLAVCQDDVGEQFPVCEQLGASVL